MGAQWAAEPSPGVWFSRNRMDTVAESRGLWRGEEPRAQCGLSSRVFCRPRLLSAIPAAAVESGDRGPFLAGCLCRCSVCPLGETIRDTFLSTL